MTTLDEARLLPLAERAAWCAEQVRLSSSSIRAAGFFFDGRDLIAQTLDELRERCAVAEKITAEAVEENEVLRSECEYYSECHDEYEQLRAEVDELREDRDWYLTEAGRLANDTTSDELRERCAELEAENEKLGYSARQFCGLHIGTTIGRCPRCLASDLEQDRHRWNLAANDACRRRVVTPDVEAGPGHLRELAALADFVTADRDRLRERCAELEARCDVLEERNEQLILSSEGTTEQMEEHAERANGAEARVAELEAELAAKGKFIRAMIGKETT